MKNFLLSLLVLVAPFVFTAKVEAQAGFTFRPGIAEGSVTFTPAAGSSSGGDGIPTLDGIGTNTTLKGVTMPLLFLGNRVLMNDIIGAGVTNVTSLDAANDYVHANGTSGNAGITNIVNANGVVLKNVVTDWHTDLATLTNSAGAGQIGETSSDAEPRIWFGRATGTGYGAWGQIIHLPGGINTIGSILGAPTNINNYRPSWFINNDPHSATLTNATRVGDSVWNFDQVSPFSCALINMSSTTTNEAYSHAGGPAIMTNVLGQKIYRYDPGMVFGTINPEWFAGYKNQPGAHVVILGYRNDNPFHISGNQTVGATLGQYPFFTVDRRGFTNGFATPISVGFPSLVEDVFEPTNSAWRWTLAVDPVNQTVSIPNGRLTVTNILSTSTNTGANVFGGNYDSTAHNNFNGSASFNTENIPYGNYGAWTFDAASTHRLGFQIQPGNYTKLTVGSTAPFIIAQSSVADLQANQTTATLSNLFVIDARKAYLSNLTSFSVIGGNVGIGTESPPELFSINTNIFGRANGEFAFGGSYAARADKPMFYQSGTGSRYVLGRNDKSGTSEVLDWAINNNALRVFGNLGAGSTFPPLARTHTSNATAQVSFRVDQTTVTNDIAQFYHANNLMAALKTNGWLHFPSNSSSSATPPAAGHFGGNGSIYWLSNGSPWVSRCLDGSTVESKSIF